MNEKAMAQALLALDRVMILTHRRPDGDTVGSAAALCLALRQCGKAAWVLENPQLTDKYRPYLDGLTCAAAAEDTTLVAVDVAAEDMLLKGLRPRPIALCIDHHETNSGYALQSLVRPERAACGEIVYDVLCEMGVALTAPIALALYVAISTDTGCFRYSNVTENTFRVASALMAVGIDAYAVNRRIFEIKRYARLRLEAHLTQTMSFYADGRIGICRISLELRDQLGLNEDDVDDISGFARKIEGVELAALLREQNDGSIKLSLRSGRQYDSAAICAQLGGGGHFSAAGATLSGPLDAAEQTLVAQIRTLYPAL